MNNNTAAPLTHDVWRGIALFLDIADIAALRCSSSHLNRALSDNAVWESLIARDMPTATRSEAALVRWLGPKRPLGLQWVDIFRTARQGPSFADPPSVAGARP
jgi:hypothetical protein